MTKPALFYRCTGHGSPTVVMDSGLGETSDTWVNVETKVAQFTRTFVYDRANMGRSGQVSHPRTSKRMVEKLHNLLLAEKVEPPYILVGHSFGGLNMLLFARLYPDQVAGLVLIDSSYIDQTERFMSVLSPELKQKYVESFFTDEGITFDERLECENEIKAAPPMPEIMIYVLMSAKERTGAGDWPYKAWDRIWREQQEEIAGLVPHSTFVIAENSGHYIQNDRPDLVIAAICEVVQAAREQGSPLDHRR